jgi:hypothetical protein
LTLARWQLLRAIRQSRMLEGTYLRVALEQPHPKLIQSSYLKVTLEQPHPKLIQSSAFTLLLYNVSSVKHPSLANGEVGSAVH